MVAGDCLPSAGAGQITSAAAINDGHTESAPSTERGTARAGTRSRERERSQRGIARREVGPGGCSIAANGELQSKAHGMPPSGKAGQRSRSDRFANRAK